MVEDGDFLKFKRILYDGMPDAEIERIEEFGEKLLPYYRRYIDHRSRVNDPASPSHPDRMREIGLRCRGIRKVVRLSRQDVSQQMDVDPVFLAAFEGGMIPPLDLPEGFAARLSGVLTTGLNSLINFLKPQNPPPDLK